MTDYEDLKGQACALFEQWADEPCTEQVEIGANGSNRHYMRLIGGKKRCMAAMNDDVRENKAFIYYSKELKAKGLNVPEVYAVSEDGRCYLQEDLGDTTLYGYLYDKKRDLVGNDPETLMWYDQALRDLAKIQVVGRSLDFSNAYPRKAFDRQSMIWDLSYFKYYYLKLAHIAFDEQLLEDDFNRLIDYLLEEDCTFFMYRDFQTRNIMMHNQTLYYIDLQGARQGAAQYDAASLLYSAKCSFAEPIRQQLLGNYIDEMGRLLGKSGEIGFKQTFKEHFYGYVLIRIMQALGAYGYRGYYERKESFLNSIPKAVNNLRSVMENYGLPVELPHLKEVLQRVIDSQWQQEQKMTADGLTVTVQSFSYKMGIPEDRSGNGGGFVFDCRALPNPGRYPEYRTFTGKDQPVIDFLKAEPAVDEFLERVKGLVGQSVECYIQRKFTNLSVNFGCTGGQHRSVYCAEKLGQWVRENFDCHVVLHHREQE